MLGFHLGTVPSYVRKMHVQVFLEGIVSYIFVAFVKVVDVIMLTKIEGF